MLILLGLVRQIDDDLHGSGVQDTSVNCIHKLEIVQILLFCITTSHWSDPGKLVRAELHLPV